MEETAVILFVVDVITFVAGLALILSVLVRGKLGYYAQYDFFFEELYDENNKIIWRKEFDNYEQWYLYDQYGDHAGTRACNGYSIAFTVCHEHCKPESGKRIRSKDSDGVEIIYEYDQYGRLIHTRRNGSTLPAETWEYSKDFPSKTEPLSYTNHEENRRTVYSYDENGHVIREERYCDKENYPVSYTEYEVDKRGRILVEKEYIDAVKIVHRIRSYNDDGDIVYEKNVIENREFYYVYLTRKGEKGYHSKICLRHVVKDT